MEWPEQLSPFVTVAKLRLPQQDISGPDNLEKMDALSFTPWRVTAEHAPLGNIRRARKEVYRHASISATSSTSSHAQNPARQTSTWGRPPVARLLGSLRCTNRLAPTR